MGEIGLRLQSVQARHQCWIRVVGTVERDLAANRRSHAGFESEQETFDVAPVRVGNAGRGPEVEAGEFQKIEQIVDRTIMGVAEAALVDPGGVLEAALLVEVPKLR